jgi:hypothetical protein
MVDFAKDEHLKLTHGPEIGLAEDRPCYPPKVGMLPTGTDLATSDW